MSHGNPQHDTPIDQHEIDLLVDGELNEERRRELLSGMDGRPDGWRQCALTFLEAQSWQQALASHGEEAGMQATALAGSVAARGDAAQPKRKKGSAAVAKAASMLLGMAALFLIALGLGTMIGNSQQKGHMGMPGSQQANLLASQDATPADPRDVTLVRDAKVYLPGKYQTVTITDQRPDGSHRSIQVPAIAQNNIDVARLRETPSAIPSDLVRAFEKAGHEVHQSRRLVPFRMKDGRRLVVPVDQLDVHYVSNFEYQ